MTDIAKIRALLDEKEYPIAADSPIARYALELRNAIGLLLDRLEGAAVISRQVPVAWVLDIDIPNYQGASEIRTVVSVHEKPTSWQGKVINEIIKSHPLYAAPQADAMNEARELFDEYVVDANFGGPRLKQLEARIDEFLARTK